MWNEHWILYPHGYILRKLFKMFSTRFPKWETWVDVPTSAVPPLSRWWLQQAEGLRWRNMSHTSLTVGDIHNLALISGPVLHSCTALKDNLEVCPHQEHLSTWASYCIFFYITTAFLLCLSSTPYLKIIYRVAAKLGSLHFCRLKDLNGLMYSYLFPSLWNPVCVYLSPSPDSELLKGREHILFILLSFSQISQSY